MENVRALLSISWDRPQRIVYGRIYRNYVILEVYMRVAAVLAPQLSATDVSLEFSFNYQVRLLGNY